MNDKGSGRAVSDGPREAVLIIALEEAKYKLIAMRQTLEELRSALQIDALNASSAS